MLIEHTRQGTGEAITFTREVRPLVMVLIASSVFVVVTVF